jgi:hypothetical protein
MQQPYVSSPGSVDDPSAVVTTGGNDKIARNITCSCRTAAAEQQKGKWLNCVFDHQTSLYRIKGGPQQ